jgi:hypothetical protein
MPAVRQQVAALVRSLILNRVVRVSRLWESLVNNPIQLLSSKQVVVSLKKERNTIIYE